MLYACKFCGYLNKEIEVLNHGTWRYSIFHAKPLGLGDWASKVFWKLSNGEWPWITMISDFHWFPQSKWLVLTRDCGRGTKMKCSQASLDLHIPHRDSSPQLAAKGSPRKFVRHGWQSASSLKKGWRQCVEFVSITIAMLVMQKVVLCLCLFHVCFEPHCCRHNLVAFTDMRFQ